MPARRRRTRPSIDVIFVLFRSRLRCHSDDPDRLICQLLDPNYVQHDAYAIFERLMATMRPWFDSGALNAADSHASSPSSPQPAEQPLFRGNTPVPVVQSSSAPVMRKCHHIQHVLLKQYDPQLYKHLEALGIEPQLYGMCARLLTPLPSSSYSVD